MSAPAEYTVCFASLCLYSLKQLKGKQKGLRHYVEICVRLNFELNMLSEIAGCSFLKGTTVWGEKIFYY